MASRADLILFDGYFFSPEREECVAEAMAIKNGAILALGSEEDVRKFYGPGTHVIDLEGRAVLPGLSDSHVHGLALGRSLGWADLSDAISISELIERLRERLKALKAHEWLVGFGWDHERF
ncbi:MAG: amidohydrolase, partial [Thermoprotei archaeon]